MKSKIITGLIIVSAILPFGAYAATQADCDSQGKTLGADNECHPTLQDCRDQGRELRGNTCISVGGGNPQDGVFAPWKGAPIVYSTRCNCLQMDISATAWYHQLLVDNAAAIKAAYPSNYAYMFPFFAPYYR